MKTDLWILLWWAKLTFSRPWIVKGQISVTPLLDVLDFLYFLLEVIVEWVCNGIYFLIYRKPYDNEY